MFLVRLLQLLCVKLLLCQLIGQCCWFCNCVMLLLQLVTLVLQVIQLSGGYLVLSLVTLVLWLGDADTVSGYAAVL